MISFLINYQFFTHPQKKTVKITPITPPKSEHKKPAKKLQKLKTSANENDKDWELVPPDGGWGWYVNEK